MTDKEKLELFKEEIKQIKDKSIKNFTKKALLTIPNHFFTVSASSTGKHHSEIDCGEGGLVKHTKAVVSVASHLFRCETIQNFSQLEKDCIVSALLLHDSLKYGETQGDFCKSTHPIEAVSFLRKHKLNEMLGIEMFTVIGNAISSHSGQWNKGYGKESCIAVNPLPKTMVERFVHLCDYIGSRNNIMIITETKMEKEKEESVES